MEKIGNKMAAAFLALALAAGATAFAAAGGNTVPGEQAMLPLGLKAALHGGQVLPEPGGLLTPNRQTLSSAVSAAGYYKGIRLAGKVRVVEHFPDIKVKVVNNFPDLRVKVVNNFPDEIGEWQFVEHFEDFSIQYVDSFEDIRVQFVTSFPGVP
ncbi:MAG: hypothetical protein VZQ81_00855 [Succiniclasticum sp.]|nr:hypothetical protein [Succiniclasticum sp.]MEE3478563.1 hypothetical protein [Succiniclasticum sp.]